MLRSRLRAIKFLAIFENEIGRNLSTIFSDMDSAIRELASRISNLVSEQNRIIAKT